LHAQLEHREIAYAHFEGAIRIGLGALTAEEALPLVAGRATEHALLRSLRGRASILVARGQPDSALIDVRRALAFDPGDAVGCRPMLAELEPAQPSRESA